MTWTNRADEKAKVTISRDSNDTIGISITDTLSGLSICRVDIEPHEFALAITGHSCIPATLTQIIDDAGYIGRKRVTKTVSCDKVIGSKKDQAEAVTADFEKHWSRDWSVFSDGTSTQQRGEKHNYILVKFVAPDEDSECGA